MFWRDDVSEADLAEYYAHTYTSAHDQQSIQQSEREYYASHMLELEQWLGVRRIGCLVERGGRPTFFGENCRVVARKA